jgi:hypothetical protein
VVPYASLRPPLTSTLGFPVKTGTDRDRVRKIPQFLLVGMLVSGVASLSGLSYMIFTAVQMVRSGRGLETYRTFWLVEFNWLSFLILLGAILVALTVALTFRVREHLSWRSLEKKYASTNKKD